MWKIAKIPRRQPTSLGNLNNKALFAFGSSVDKIEVLVSDLMDETKQGEEKRTRDIFAQNIFKLYMFEQARENNLKNHERSLTIRAINSPQPLKDILIAHQTVNKRGFDEDLLALSLSFLARTYESLGEGTRLYEDLDTIGIHENHRFIDMVEDIKYGLKRGVHFSAKNIAQVFQALRKLEYKNNDLIDLLWEKLALIVQLNDDQLSINEDTPAENPQSIKKYYYSKTLIDVRGLVENENFLKNLGETLSYKEEGLLIDSKRDEKKGLTEEEQITLLVESIRGMLIKDENNIKEVTRAVLAIRDQYTKMIKAQDSFENIKTNDNLNLELLRMEELLLELGLITIEEVKNPELIKNEVSNLESTTAIVSDFLNRYRNNFEKFSELFLTKALKKSSENSTYSPENLKTFLMKSQSPDYLNITRTLVSVADIVSSEAREFRGRDYLNPGWNNIFLEEEDRLSSKDPKTRAAKLNIIGDRIYTQAFISTLKKFIDYQPHFNSMVKKIDTEALLNLSYSYSRLGLSTTGEQFYREFLRRSDAIDGVKDLNILLQTIQLLPVSVSAGDYRGSSAKLLSSILKRKGENLTLAEASNAIVSASILSDSEALGDGLIEGLFNRFFEELEQEKNLSVLATDLLRIITDVKYIAEKNLLNLGRSPIEEERRKDLLFGIKQHSVFKNPLVTPYDPLKANFLKIASKYLENKGINFERADLAYLPQQYHPDQFTSTQKKNSGIEKRGIYFIGSERADLQSGVITQLEKLRSKIVETLTNNRFTCEHVPVFKQIYSINLDKKAIELRDSSELKEFISASLLRKSQGRSEPYLERMNQVGSGLLQIYEHHYNALSKRNKLALELILSRIALIFKLKNKLESDKIEDLNNLIINKMKFTLFRIRQDLDLFDKSFAQTIDANLQGIFPGSLGLDDVLHKIKTGLSELQIENRSRVGKEVLQPWMGRRLSCELPPNELGSDGGLSNIDYELIDLNFYKDRSYNNYPSWERRLRSLTASNLSFVKPENFLFNLMLTDAGSRLYAEVLPEYNRERNQLRPLSFQWNWESMYLRQTETQKTQVENYERLANMTQRQFTEDDKFIINLQNFKYELKRNSSIDAISEFISNAEFIEELIKEHVKQIKGGLKQSIQEESPRYAVRHSEDVFAFFENKRDNDIFRQSYGAYLIERIEKKEKLKNLMRIKNHYLKELFKDHQAGKVSIEDYEEIREDVFNSIKKELSQLEKERDDGNYLSEKSRKYFDIQYDLKDLADNQGYINYDKNFDRDYILSNGNEEVMLESKRVEAEKSLIKIRLIKKICENKPLSAIEKEYFTLWKEESASPLKQPYAVQSSKLSIRSLKENDRAFLNSLQYSKLNEFEAFSLNDLSMELSLFVNRRLIQQIELRFKADSLEREWDINKSLFVFGSSQNSNLLSELENEIWKSSARIEESDSLILKEMLQILRNNTDKDRKNLERDEKLVEQTIELVNEFPNRFEVLSQWLGRIEKENKEGKTELKKTVKAKKEAAVMELWKEMFKKDYNETSTDELHEFSGYLVERFHLLRKTSPLSLPWLLKALLRHPMLNILDLNLILSHLQYFDLNIPVDSEDIINLLQRRKTIESPTTLITLKNYKEILQKSSNNYIEELYKRMNSSSIVY